MPCRQSNLLFVIRRLLRSDACGAIPRNDVLNMRVYLDTLGCRLNQSEIETMARQFRVLDGIGRFVARVDVAIPDVRLAIEAHSRRHHFGSGPERRDEERDLRLAAAGWEVLYMRWHRTSAPDELLAIVEAVVEARKLVV